MSGRLVFSKGVSFKAVPFHVWGKEHHEATVRLRQAVKCFKAAVRRHGKRMRSDPQSCGGRNGDHTRELSVVANRALVDAAQTAQWCRDWGCHFKHYPTVWFLWNRVAEACDKLVEPQRLMKEADAKLAKDLEGGLKLETFKFGTVSTVGMTTALDPKKE